MLGVNSRTAIRAVGSGLVVVVVLLTQVSTAAAAASITVEPSSASPGDFITISGNVPTDGCPSSDAAQLTSTAELFPPDGFGPPATRAPTGDFSTQYAIPASTPPGDYSIGVRCGGGNVGISAVLHVVEATTTTASTTTTTKPTTTSASTTTSTTTMASASSAPPSSSAAASKKSTSALPWVLLALAAVVAALTAIFYRRSRRTE
jgi:hypothetical protein